MTAESASGPSWLGIGSQRSGTTWLTGLLLEHPQVTLGRSRLKESHFFYRGLLPGYTPWLIGPTPDLKRIPGAMRRKARRLWSGNGRAHPGDSSQERYISEHSHPTLKRGEWTPDYLACIWAAPYVRDVLPDDAPIFVVLRDPVERFASALRLEASRRSVHSPVLADRLLGGYATWCGMYLQQLEAWARVLGRERLVVAQYEQVRTDPQAWADASWRALGLTPVPLTRATDASRTSRPTGWDWPDGLRSQVSALYRDQRAGLERHWNIDTSLWIDQA